MEKRERRCETCAAWARERATDLEAPCRARAPDGNGLTLMDANEFCIIDYTPIGAANTPGRDELMRLPRILANEQILMECRDRIDALTDNVGRLMGHSVHLRDVMEPRLEKLEEIATHPVMFHEMTFPAAVNGEIHMDPSPECMPAEDAAAFMKHTAETVNLCDRCGKRRGCQKCKDSILVTACEAYIKGGEP